MNILKFKILFILLIFILNDHSIGQQNDIVSGEWEFDYMEVKLHTNPSMESTVKKDENNYELMLLEKGGIFVSQVKLNGEEELKSGKWIIINDKIAIIETEKEMICNYEMPDESTLVLIPYKMKKVKNPRNKRDKKLYEQSAKIVYTRK
tara:strand:- start:218 stop:664 length:447 start_codon:yes stop_codon:yes gene_type:complete